jgi:hypothetical protein
LNELVSIPHIVNESPFRFPLVVILAKPAFVVVIHIVVPADEVKGAFDFFKGFEHHVPLILSVVKDNVAEHKNVMRLLFHHLCDEIIEKFRLILQVINVTKSDDANSGILAAVLVYGQLTFEK